MKEFLKSTRGDFELKDISLQFGGVGTVVKTLNAFISVLCSVQRDAALWSSRLFFFLFFFKLQECNL